jgi:hypothetical protein
LLAALPFASCVRQPEYFAPPQQRQPFEVDPQPKLRHFLAMSMPEADLYFVSGILPTLEGGMWRWTEPACALRFQLPTTEGLKLFLDLTVPQETLSQAGGPARVKVWVQDRLLDTIEFAKADTRQWEKPVPAEWLGTSAPVIVRFEIDKAWTNPQDGSKRGFILSKAGFVQ